MIPVSISKQTATTPDRGLKELSVPADVMGNIGISNVHFNMQFTQWLFLGGIPQGIASLGAVYLSTIHGGLGSDSTNQFTAAFGTFPAEFDIPAFPNPEVTGYYNTGPDVGNKLTNGYLNSEKQKRAPTDGGQVVLNDATAWAATDGRRRLIFSLWVNSVTGPASDLYMLEVYRDLNQQDKNFGIWGGPTNNDPTNAQLIYQYGPFQSLPNSSSRQANAQVAEPVDLPAGCNLYCVLRNITNALTANNIIGSIRLVP